MFQIFTAGLLWGTIGIFVKGLAALGADSALTCFLRMSSAFVIMLALSVLRHGRGAIIRDKYTLFLCVMLGLVCHGIFNVFYTSSIKINGMGIACVLMYTAPVFTAVASRIIFHEKFPPLKIFALILNIAGCILTVTGGNFTGGNINMAGILAGIGTGFCYGMAAVFGRLAGEKTDSLTMSAYSYLAAAVFIALYMRPNISAVNTNILLLGLLYGIIPTSLAYVVYYDGLRKVADTGKVPVIASVEPVAAVVIGMMVYGEEMSTGNFIGVAVVLISIIIMSKAE